MPVVIVIAHTKFLGVPNEMLPEAFVANRSLSLADIGQDIGTDAERLTECAGRVCYDSYGKGRKSEEYHNHIRDVAHDSVGNHSWITFFLSGLSRGCTMELNRHHVGTAISQRSTRYVDEAGSRWILHPLLEEALMTDNITGAPQVCAAIAAGRDCYTTLVEALEKYLIRKGVDKFTARKQSRGAARGYLGNALETEMVWSVNITALRHILRMRAQDAADAEIRILANALHQAALPYFGSYLRGFKAVPATDGLGDVLVDTDSQVYRLQCEVARLTAELADKATTSAPSDLHG